MATYTFDELSISSGTQKTVKNGVWSEAFQVVYIDLDTEEDLVLTLDQVELLCKQLKEEKKKAELFSLSVGAN